MTSAARVRASRPTRILLTADAVGGVWQYSVDLARGLAPLGFEVVLAVLGPSPSAAQRLAAEAVPGLQLIDTGLPLDWLAGSAASVHAAGAEISSLAEHCGADLVQLNTPALAAEARSFLPVVAVAHSCLATWWAAVEGTELTPLFRWRSELTAKGLKSADLVVAPTRAFAEATRQAYRLPSPPVAVPNGRTPLALPKVAAHDFAFTAGRLWDRGKNLAALDRAAARLTIPFYAAGPAEGPGGDAVAFEHLHGLGSLDEPQLARWLAARPVFVSAALYEPFGLAVLEAAAAGCPLVLSDIPTFRELWDGVAHFVPAADDAAIAAAVAAIVGDGIRRAEMGRKARERAARYTPEAMGRRMAALYSALLHRSALSGPTAEAAA